MSIDVVPKKCLNVLILVYTVPGIGTMRDEVLVCQGRAPTVLDLVLLIDRHLVFRIVLHRPKKIQSVC